MAFSDPPPAEPTPPELPDGTPPEAPPDPVPPPAETPPTMQDQAQAKPSEPGPADPPGIATSVLPERREDAGRARQTKSAGVAPSA